MIPLTPRPGARWRERGQYVVLALLTVVAGLLVHRGLVPLPPRARDVAGDALWAAMVYWLVGAAAPRARVGRRAAAALGVAWAVELGQLVRAPWLVALRGTGIGRLVLGTDFDARDLAAYAAGVAGAVLLARGARRAGRARAAVTSPASR